MRELQANRPAPPAPAQPAAAATPAPAPAAAPVAPPRAFAAEPPPRTLAANSLAAATVNPATVHLRSLSQPGRLPVLEQNYEYDLVNADKIGGHAFSLERLGAVHPCGNVVLVPINQSRLQSEKIQSGDWND